MNPIGIIIGLVFLFSLFWSLGAQACNLTLNPSFEASEAGGWTWKADGPYWHGFLATSERKHSGDRSALLRLQNGPVGPQAQIWGAIQEFPVSKLPRKLGLWYRVENWRQAVTRQYIQIVIMIHDERLKKLVGLPHMQLRYILAGLSEAPYPDPVNGRFLVAGSRKPRQGRWIRFETDPLRDFIKAWGWYPENFQKLEIFLEARYDEAIPTGQTVSGDIYWDDVDLCL